MKIANIYPIIMVFEGAISYVPYIRDRVAKRAADHGRLDVVRRVMPTTAKHMPARLGYLIQGHNRASEDAVRAAHKAGFRDSGEGAPTTTQDFFLTRADLHHKAAQALIQRLNSMRDPRNSRRF